MTSSSLQPSDMPPGKTPQSDVQAGDSKSSSPLLDLPVDRLNQIAALAIYNPCPVSLDAKRQSISTNSRAVVKIQQPAFVMVCKDLQKVTRQVQYGVNLFSLKVTFGDQKVEKTLAKMLELGTIDKGTAKQIRFRLIIDMPKSFDDVVNFISQFRYEHSPQQKFKYLIDIGSQRVLAPSSDGRLSSTPENTTYPHAVVFEMMIHALKQLGMSLDEDASKEVAEQKLVEWIFDKEGEDQEARNGLRSIPLVMADDRFRGRRSELYEAWPRHW